MVKCNYCGKLGKIGKPLEHYIIADDIEHPQPYHPSCFKKFQLEIIMGKRDIKNVAKTSKKRSEI